MCIVHLLSLIFQKFDKPGGIWYVYVPSRAVGIGWRGAYFGKSFNPVSIRGGVSLCPPRYYSPPPPFSDPPTALTRYMNFSFENKNPNQKPSIFPALIILPGTHWRYKNEKPSIKWVLFTNASHNTILYFVAIRFMSIQMLGSTQCTVGFTNWHNNFF